MLEALGATRIGYSPLVPDLLYPADLDPNTTVCDQLAGIAAMPLADCTAELMPVWAPAPGWSPPAEMGARRSIGVTALGTSIMAAGGGSRRAQ